MANKIQKTNAIRLVEQQKVAHDIFQYDVDRDNVDGITVAQKIGHRTDEVFKTLVATAGTSKYFVFVIPVQAELNLKLAAKVVGEKKVEMLPVKELLGLTGYVRGGCSPIGMKKLFPTVIDASAQSLPHMIVSAGKLGMQMQLAVDDLARLTKATVAPITQ